VDGKESSEKPKSIPDKPMNKTIMFDFDSWAEGVWAVLRTGARH
jgi:hypothetical protein